jgi:outer membrane protein assembly factor BamB
VGGLAFGPGGVFYGLDQFGNTLFALNATTGTSTASTPLSGFDPSVDTVGGLVFGADGTLYAAISADGVTSEWFSINPTTGVANEIGSMGSYDIVGLALLGTPVVNPVPEPDSFALMGTGGLVLLVLLRRRLKG